MASPVICGTYVHPPSIEAAPNLIINAAVPVHLICLILPRYRDSPKEGRGEKRRDPETKETIDRGTKERTQRTLL
jgi:hypothetical protein